MSFKLQFYANTSVQKPPWFQVLHLPKVGLCVFLRRLVLCVWFSR